MVDKEPSTSKEKDEEELNTNGTQLFKLKVSKWIERSHTLEATLNTNFERTSRSQSKVNYALMAQVMMNDGP